jgi:hypothetical protein
MSSESKPHTESSQTPYHAPILTDYGKMSELTQTTTGNTGDDGGGVPSSYTAS